MDQRYSEGRRGWAAAAMLMGFGFVLVLVAGVLLLVPGILEFSAPVEKNIGGAILTGIVLVFVACFFIMQWVESVVDKGEPGQLERIFWGFLIPTLLLLAGGGLVAIGAI